jgi:xylan 1,4-beta-xylosidase
VLATNGIVLPVLNVFRMFSKMGGQRVATKSSGEVPLDAIIATGVREAPDVAALSSLEKNKLCVLLWHYHDDDVAGPDAQVELALNRLPSRSGKARVTRYEIDQTHSNAYAEWVRMGSPHEPNEAQYAVMKQAGQLATVSDAPAELTVSDGAATLKLTLPRQAVTLLEIELPTSP